MNVELDKSRGTTLLILFLTLSGLAGIYFAVKDIKPAELEIGSIEQSMEGRLVKIRGHIDYIRKSKSGNSYLTVSDGNNITVPILDPRLKKISVKKGDEIGVVGLVSIYNGELEVLPKEINVR